MSKGLTIAMLALAALALPGCVRTVGKVVTLPVRATAQAADWATTSQDEADRNHGRKIRKQCREEYNPDYCER